MRSSNSGFEFLRLPLFYFFLRGIRLRLAFPMKFLENISTLILNTTLIGLVGIGIMVVGSMLPIFGTNRIFVVQSGSMEPAIRTGSIIFVSPASSYGIGDIVTWQPISGGTPITHRIVRELPELSGMKFQTKGDANESEDSAIDEKQILGRVVGDIPFLGYPVSFAKTPIGFILLIFFPSLLIIFDEILNLKREFSKRAYQSKNPIAKISFLPSSLHNTHSTALPKSLPKISPSAQSIRKTRFV